MEITEAMWIELGLTVQELADRLDEYLASTKNSGVYTSEAPEYVKEYIKKRKMAGENKWVRQQKD